jgi:hypothetical protein
MLADYPFRLFIEDYFASRIRRVGPHTSLRTSLAALGLLPEVVAVLVPLLEPLQNSSYTDYQILDTAILYLLGNYAPIAPINTTHIIQSDQVNKWVEYEDSIQIYNLSQNCSMNALLFLDEAVSQLPLATGHSFFFHTTSWGGSLNIIDKVDRMVGRRCLDFGIYPGFYMSETVRDCLDWGAKKSKIWGNETAIMIFAIPNTLPSHVSLKELQGREWLNITKQARECKLTQELKSIRSVDLLYGNMVSNVVVVSMGENPIPHTPPKKQLVSKSDNGDTFIHSCLVGCIYFQKFS